MDSEFEIEKNENLVVASLIAMFFRGNLTQTAFKLVIEHTQLLTPIKLPKTLDQLLGRLEQEELTNTKQWFCQSCIKKITLANNKQRRCLNLIEKKETVNNKTTVKLVPCNTK